MSDIAPRPPSGALTNEAFLATWLRLVFLVLLSVHLFLVTRNWSSESLPGHEFRQTQTAISAYHIRADNNFSLSYPTPVLGKPWSIPMEFPLYQWCVVRLSNGLDLSLTQAGRSVSLACFYLMLPGLYVLLLHLSVPPSARWLCLALVVSSPLYVFYSRAFMIESMALMLAVWFLAAFVAVMRSGQWLWFPLAALCGAGAALVKVTTLMMWMAPAAAYGAYLLGRNLRSGWRPFRSVLLRGLLLATGPCLAALWWVKTADGIKELNPSGQFLMSGPMKTFNFATWTTRIQGEIWQGMLQNWDKALMPLWLMVVVALAIALAGSIWRRLGVLAAAVFLSAHLTFPGLFAWHDYYLYAVGPFWLGATALALHSLSCYRFGRALVLSVMLLVVGVQMNSYRANYYREQTTSGNGGTGLTDALRALTPRQGVLVVAGYDWSSIVPYYAQRKALMLRVNFEDNVAYLETAFQGLAGEEIAALVLSGSQRSNKILLEKAADTFALDPSVAFSYRDTDVYLPTARRDWTVSRLRDAKVFDQVEPRGEAPAHAELPVMNESVVTVNPNTDRALFGHMSPMPVRYRFSFDPNAGTLDGRPMIGAHPDSEIWFITPKGMDQVVCEFGILPGAYEREGSATDGVEFTVIERKQNGTESVLYRRHLQPSTEPSDRGMQKVTFPCRPAPGSELVFVTRSGGSFAYDWAYWGPITLH